MSSEFVTPRCIIDDADDDGRTRNWGWPSDQASAWTCEAVGMLIVDAVMH